MKWKLALSVFAFLLSLTACTTAFAGGQKTARRHSAAWYRTHRNTRKHSAAWYRSHRPKAKHSAAWYRTHRKHK